jgi:hypothetical protein
VLLQFGLAAVWSILGNEEKDFVTRQGSVISRLSEIQVSLSSSSISVVLGIKNRGKYGTREEK